MKQKDNSTAKKRFKKTGSGKVMHAKSCKNHLLKNKSKRQKGLGKQGVLLDYANRDKVTQLVPGL